MFKEKQSHAGMWTIELSRNESLHMDNARLNMDFSDDAFTVRTAETSCQDGYNNHISQNSKLAVKDDTNLKKNVQFSTIHVREYDICLGDNPSVARGAPISLDWTYKGREHCYSIEDYERSEHFSGPRDHSSICDFSSPDPLKLPSLERLHLLKDLGYSRREIKEAMDTVGKIRNQRFQTMRQVERVDRLRSLVKIFCCFSYERSNERDHLADSVSTADTCGWTVSPAESVSETLLQQVAKQQGVGENRRERQVAWRRKHRDSLTLVGDQRRIRRVNMFGLVEMHRNWRKKKWYREKQSQHCESLDRARHKSVKLEL